MTRLDRLYAIGKGATINGTYRTSPDEALAAFRADLIAVAGGIALFAKDLKATNDDNVSRAMEQRMCCNGTDCGCRGSTIGEYLAYQLMESVR